MAIYIHTIIIIYPFMHIYTYEHRLCTWSNTSCESGFPLRSLISDKQIHLQSLEKGGELGFGPPS